MHAGERSSWLRLVAKVFMSQHCAQEFRRLTMSLLLSVCLICRKLVTALRSMHSRPLVDLRRWLLTLPMRVPPPALDRIAVAVPMIRVQSFRCARQQCVAIARRNDSIRYRSGRKRRGQKRINTDFVRHFYCRVVPGIADRFDGPQMLPLVAPRPLMVINGDSDSLTRVPGSGVIGDGARLRENRGGVHPVVRHENRGLSPIPRCRAITS